jgi:hypothetical protein
MTGLCISAAQAAELFVRVPHGLNRSHTLTGGAEAPRVAPDFAGHALGLDLIEDGTAPLESVNRKVAGDLFVSEIASQPLPAEVLRFGQVIAFICHVLSLPAF